MLSNNTYNLLRQLTEESTSLKRITDEYLQDAQGNDVCTHFWQKMQEDKEAHISELTELLKQEL